MEWTEVEEDVTMSETTAEIEIGAAASNDSSNPARLRQVVRVDHGSAGDGSGSNGRLTTLAGAAGETMENRNQSPSE